MEKIELLTKADLEDFKKDLIEQIRTLIQTSEQYHFPFLRQGKGGTGRGNPAADQQALTTKNYKRMNIF